MKLFWVILKGFLIIWSLLALTSFALAAVIWGVRTAIPVAGIFSTLVAGTLVYFIVQSKVKMVEKAHPELRKRRR